MLLPRPESFAAGTGTFELDEQTVIIAPATLGRVTPWLVHRLRSATGLPLPETVPGGSDVNSIALACADGLGPEEFRLTSYPTGVRIVGGSAAGVFYGCQALLQLLPPDVYRQAPSAETIWAVPEVTISDGPRFGWRGLMLDVARHFLPKHDVLRLIDLMAMHRLNVLHFHLTDDQGWRIPIAAYPRLAEVGAWRTESQVGATADSPGDGRPHGGSYTRDDLREIVAYAGARNITVVPEIEMPGHVQAAIAAYPEIGVTGRPVAVGTRWGIIANVANIEDATLAFFCDVLDEVMAIFPGEFIHVGGDECPRVAWESDPRTRELMREHGITRAADVQTYFMARIGEHVAARGRRMIGWDEILEGDVPAGTVVSSWRGMHGAIAAARRGYDVISCPTDPAYLDFRQSDLPDEPIPVAIPVTVEDAYRFEPVPPGLTDAEARHILGGQANVWTEHMDSPRTIDYFTFPRLCAIAEALWSRGGKDVADFSERLTEHLHRLDAIGVEYRRDTGPLPWQTRPGIPGRPTDRAEWEKRMAALAATITE